MAERAGPARAAEFVMSGGLYDAATLERWNVVSRVVPDDELLEKGMKFAHRLADGPTIAHGATKRIIRGYRDGRRGGGRPGHAGGLRRAVRLGGSAERGGSFLEQGPGKATFEGR